MNFTLLSRVRNRFSAFATRDFLVYLRLFLRFLRENRKIRFVLIASVLIFSIHWIVVESASYYVRTRLLDLRGLKELSRNFINRELGRAVTLGVVEYDFPNAVVFEDFRISSEEDFALNHILLKTNKIQFKLGGLWKGQPFIRGISVKDASINLDLKDQISGELIGYIQKINIPEIRLTNTTITISRDGEEVLNSLKGIDILIAKQPQGVVVTVSDSTFPLPYSRFIHGTFETSFQSDESKSEFRFQNVKAEKVRGLYSLFGKTAFQSGKISGEYKILIRGKKISVKGKNRYDNVSGRILQDLPLGLKLPDLKDADFDHEMDLELDESQEKQVHTFSKEENRFRLTYFVGPKKLAAWETFVDWKNLRSLRSVLQFSGDLETLEGQLNLKGKWEESGNYGDWIKSEVSLSLMGFHWKDPYIDLRLDQSNADIVSGNQLSFGAKGSLFQEPFSVKIAGKTGWKKSPRANGAFFYPWYNDWKWDLELDRISVKDFLPIYHSWKNYIRNDIRTRQEKLIPEIRWTRTPFYKYLMEFFTANIRWKLKSFRFKERDLGKATLEGKVVPFFSRLDLKGYREETQFVEAFANFTFGQDNPYMDLRLKATELPWEEPINGFCGAWIVPETVTSDVTIRLFGDDFLALHNSLNVLNNVSYNRSKFQDKRSFPLNLREPFDFGYEHNILPTLSYYRNIFWKNESADLTGYGAVEPNRIRISANGKLNDAYVNRKFREEAGECKLESTGDR
ncbi:hypothetical protein EHQ12_03650 [Leptospira gomenensis]|uniref:AsmA domain protein n=1 Tax=Leptospira gomenensis TaxID=2484974 RepID=A0A5F1Y969_9LEPT|nr:hypothetical protein EHQ17_12905 [Leptospira gomenensis]TGK41711.1 hypothetical protein EHQ07_16565 [Leptospira gomenensis]TGK43398.1 hypothetical protein EHQ12_03650 [Leptospira gomenensis]TGK61497.1 hypothetical protein EHQ13_08300 [Leptospira gomenensis]